jgi:integration host factor subunit beta
MNKLGLIKALEQENGLTEQEATTIVNMFFDEMANTLAEGDRVEIRGFCRFFVKKYKSYTGMNPKTKEKTRVKPKKLPVFRCGKDLMERVDY